MDKYFPIINAINLTVDQFNKVLLPQYHIKHLDISNIRDENYFSTLNGKQWENLQFPKGRDYGGVYFYFGYNIQNPNQIGVYIGKASLNRNIGHRLWNHFYGMDSQRDNEQRLMRHDNYSIELITTIPIGNREQVFLAPALEEYLIMNLKCENVFKFNYVGNY